MADVKAEQVVDLSDALQQLSTSENAPVPSSFVPPSTPESEQQQTPRRNHRRSKAKLAAKKDGRSGGGGDNPAISEVKPLLILPSPPPLPLELCPQKRGQVFGFEDGTWAAADWYEKNAPRSYSGFFLPLLFGGLASRGDESAFNAAMSSVADSHFAGRSKATIASIVATQPLWQATFSHWSEWVALVSEALAAQKVSLDDLKKGVSSKAAFIVPAKVAGLSQEAYGVVPHLKPAIQNDLIENALGPVESSRFYASISSLFMRS